MRRIRIDTVSGAEMAVCAVRSRGLAITRGCLNDGWTVTHIASGRRVGALAGLPLRAARTAFELLLALGDWRELDYGAIPKAVGLACAVVAEMVDA